MTKEEDQMKESLAFNAIQRQKSAAPVIDESSATILQQQKMSQSPSEDQMMSCSDYLDLFERVHSACNIETYDK